MYLCNKGLLAMNQRTATVVFSVIQSLSPVFTFDCGINHVRYITKISWIFQWYKLQINWSTCLSVTDHFLKVCNGMCVYQKLFRRQVLAFGIWYQCKDKFLGNGASCIALGAMFQKLERFLYSYACLPISMQAYAVNKVIAKFHFT